MTAETLALCCDYVAIVDRIGQARGLLELEERYDAAKPLRDKLNAIFETHMTVLAMDRRCRNIIASCEMLQAGAEQEA